MKSSSSLHLQNGNSRVNFDNDNGINGGGGNGDISRMNNSGNALSGGVGGGGATGVKSSSSSSLSSAAASLLNNGFANGKTNNNNNKTALNQTKAYQRKVGRNGLDAIDFDDDEKTNSFGLSRRKHDGLLATVSAVVSASEQSTLKNTTSSQLYIDEKNIALHLNNPFVTDFVVSSSSQSSSPSATMFNQRAGIDRTTFYGGAPGMPQSASTSQLSNVIKSHQLKNYIGGTSSGSNENNGAAAGGRPNDIDANTLRMNNRPKRPHSIAGVLSPALLSSSAISSSSSASGSSGRISILNSNHKDELSGGAATTTMTYNNNNGNTNGPNNNPTLNNGIGAGNNIASNNALNGSGGGTKVFNQPQNNEYAQQASTHVSYGHFINSPARLTGAAAAALAAGAPNRQASQATSQEFSLYTPPPLASSASFSSSSGLLSLSLSSSMPPTIGGSGGGANATSINNNSLANNNHNPQSMHTRQQQPPPIVQRRSHSTPRSIQSTTATTQMPAAISIENGNKSTPSTVNNANNDINGSGIVLRPRSLDRAR